MSEVSTTQPKAASLTRVTYVESSGLPAWEGVITGEIAGTSSFPYYTSQIPNVDQAQTIRIGDDVTSIGAYAFYRCSGLTSVTISNSVTNIEDYAFCGCNGLTNVMIPESVTKIGYGVFTECANLGSISVAAGNQTYKIDSGLLLTKDGKLLVAAAGRMENVIIPDNVTSIGYGAFNSCWNLKSVTIPSTVTSLGDYAFFFCDGLTNMTIPDSVTSIGRYVFHNCSGLASVTIPDSVTNIGMGAFGHCNCLTSVTISNSVTSIESQAFYGCSGLTSITIPNSVTSIGETAFASCSGLTSVTIPDSVRSIGFSAFNGCSGLTSVMLGGGLTSILPYAFQQCSGLTSVTIPSNVTSIGNYAFSDCSGLTSVEFDGNAPTVGDRVFTGVASGCKAIISPTATGFPAAGEMWNGLIIEIKGNNQFNFLYKREGDTEWQQHVPTSYDIDYIDGKVTITASDFKEQSWFADVREVKLPNKWKDNDQDVDVVSIGGSAFSRCSGLTNVNIPDSVTSIWDYAFEDCEGLTSVTLGNGMTNIGNLAFHNCSGLTNVMFPYSVTSIGWGAFRGCEGLTSVTIPDSVKNIRNEAFFDCTSLTSVTITFNGGHTEDVKYMLVSAGCPSDITWIATIIFEVNGGTSIQPMAADMDSYIRLPTAVKDGYTFLGWLDGDELVGSGLLYHVTESKALVAQWKTSFAIIWNPNGGEYAEGDAQVWAGIGIGEIGTTYGTIRTKARPKSEQGSETYSFGDIPIPTREHHVFNGWWIDQVSEEDAQIADDTIFEGSDQMLYAHWTPIQHTITFQTGEGSPVPAITQGYGTAITPPSDPTREGYVFQKWKPAIPETMPDEDVVCIAMWGYIERYTITWDGNGGTPSRTSDTMDANLQIESLPSAEKDNYTLVGWFTSTDIQKGSRVYAPLTVVEDATYYARWTPTEHVISYNMNGHGEVPYAAQTTYSIESRDYTPPDPYPIMGYTFAGWTPESISSGSSGNVTFAAKWIDDATGKLVPMSPSRTWNPDESTWKPIALCCVAKAGSENMRDWVNHHLGLGFDHIYIYNDGTADGFKAILEESPVDEVSIVDFVHVREKDPKTTAYAHCYREHRSQFGWIAFFDPDEYLVVQNGQSIKNVMHSRNYGGFEVVRLNVVQFSDYIQMTRDYGIAAEEIVGADDVASSRRQAKSIVDCRTSGILFKGYTPTRNGTHITQCLPNLDVVENGNSANGSSGSDVNKVDTTIMYLTPNRLELEWVKWKQARNF